jgi:hypothetical protein
MAGGEKSRTFPNWFAQRIFPQRRENVERYEIQAYLIKVPFELRLRGSITSPLHPLKVKEHVIPDRPKQGQVGNAAID